MFSVSFTGEKADCDAPIADPYKDFGLQGLFQGEDQEQIASPHLLLSRALTCALTSVKDQQLLDLDWIGVINPDQNWFF